jgi:sugar O-acyltransferase (sialic acid O-acetyltransferase NeuD family)
MINIVGAGGMARDWIAYMRYHPAFINQFADNPKPVGFSGRVVNDLSDLKSEASFICVGDPAVRKSLWERIGKPYGLDFDYRAEFGARIYTDPGMIKGGTMICPGAVINAKARIGNHCLVHVNSTVGHDTILYDFVSLMPGAHVGGNCHLEEGVFVGAGAVINPGVRVGAWTKIGAGAIISHDLPANSVWVQAGAKRIS